MKFTILFAIFSLLRGAAQIAAPGPRNAPADLSPDTVLATVEGKKLTFGEFKTFIGALSPEMQKSALSDRKAFLQQFGLMLRLSGMAEKAKLDERSPYKETIELNRMNLLMNAQVNEAFNNIVVSAEDQQKFYDEHKDRYSQVKVKVIYIPFSSNASSKPDSKGKQPLTETEAKAKIEKLLAEIRGGADFVKLVKEHSEDATSAAKEGDFGTIRRSDNIPEAIRSAVFALKPSQVSEPVRQPNGFYLFRAEEVKTRSYAEVKDEIFTEIKQERMKEWLESNRQKVSVTIENEAFFSGPSPVPMRAPAVKTN